MSILDWPKKDRPRERLLELGCDQLTDSELLAILIQNGTKTLSSVDCARHLLSTFGNIRGIIDADLQTFCSQPGLGAAKFAYIQAAAEVGRRYLQQAPICQGAITSVQQAKQYFQCALTHKKYECVGILYLNSAHNILLYDEPFKGSISKVYLHYRDCIQKALQLNATALLMAHNHPTGIAAPSQADIDSTMSFIKALKLVDITLIDHIIVGSEDCFSMRDNGLLECNTHVV